MMMRSDSLAQSFEDTSIEMANEILMYFSEARPMLRCLVDATADFVKQSDLSISNTTDTLATFVYVYFILVVHLTKYYFRFVGIC